MSILGITLDLNVYGFLDALDRHFTPNFIDDESRYRFGAQPEMMRWNLRRLADALSGQPFAEDHESDRRSWLGRGGARHDDDGTPRESQWLGEAAVARELARFGPRYEECFAARMQLKLGAPSSVRSLKWSSLSTSAAAYHPSSPAPGHIVHAVHAVDAVAAQIG
jgi:uncharacterized protein YdiU (UPF0061 family)